MNGLNNFDFDQDGTHSPLEVLNIVNNINQGGSGTLVQFVPQALPQVKCCEKF
jgi:hypothetical protein